MRFMPTSFILLWAVILLLVFLLIVDEIRVRRLQRDIGDKHATLALISHQLRTPLSSVKWHAEMLIDQEFGELKIAQLELLHKMTSGLSEAIMTLGKFLEASRFERGEIVSAPVMIDVSRHLDRVALSLAPILKDNQHEIVRDKNPTMICVYMDPILFHSVFETILENAIVYTPPHGRIFISAMQEGENVTICIQDTGIGMTDFDQKILFTKFFRSEESRIKNTNGNGLSLYTVKMLLDAIGGTIKIRSQQGKGTTVCVTLPTDLPKH